MNSTLWEGALRHAARFGALAAVAVSLNLCTTPAAAQAAVVRASPLDIVVTGSGPLRGTSVSGMRAFLGIPYAAPPVGVLRWRPPSSHARWSAPRAATKFGAHCPQPAGPFGIASLTEDCLFLNVFSPPGARANSALPVMVWIHGGAFTVGESDDYNPVRLVERNVIVVTLNYRLGRLGFLAHPALDAEDHAKINYGLMDQQQALRWVHQNIRAFGGDPARTTIFGESAGGLSVNSQLASPKAASLFRAAIVESGDYQLALPTLAASELQGSQVAEAVGCKNQSAACLRSLSVAQVIAGEPSGVVPSVDGVILPLSLDVAFSTGAFNRVPVVNGSNHDEWRLFTALDFDLVGGPITPAVYPAAVAGLVGPAAAPFVLKQYPLAKYPNPDLAYAFLGTDAVFACPAYGADSLLSNFVPTYAYQFVDEQAPEPFLPPVRSFKYGAAHASEIQFLFGSFFAPSPALSPAELQLSAEMVGRWTEFAKSREGWRPFSAFAGDVLELTPPQSHLEFDFVAEHQCAFWASLAAGASATANARPMPGAMRVR